jgi:hypothetical protein
MGECRVGVAGTALGLTSIPRVDATVHTPSAKPRVVKLSGMSTT